ncbi:MAG: tRNA preQ1(34) S-adenosylmethionine ribosyltransferase-isomerase QueA [Elusimicrobiota bacterium]|nr:tRNA preQ1(34) S-adenosylmethionine ribosyltransferase-isomerase QueA [Elusimicrobiota bacterium]
MKKTAGFCNLPYALNFKLFAEKPVRSSLFDFDLPGELIAQKPAKKRDGSNLMVFDRSNGKRHLEKFSSIAGYFKKGDVLILNNTKVIPARLSAKRKTGGKVEIFVLRHVKKQKLYECLIKPLKKVKTGETLLLKNSFKCTVIEKIKGRAIIEFNADIKEILSLCGKIPFPPYIHEKKQDPRRYQTVFAENEGAVAAPTAGLHFTKEILRKLKRKGVEINFITLHTGFGTFTPLRGQTIEEHQMDEEFFTISEKTAGTVNRAVTEKRRVFACGTTVTRTLESNAYKKNGKYLLHPGSGSTAMYITPPYKFKIVKTLITNFHTPLSSLIVLVSAFAGRKNILECYKEAIKLKWRFFSFGDAMLIL